MKALTLKVLKTRRQMHSRTFFLTKDSEVHLYNKPISADCSISFYTSPYRAKRRCSIYQKSCYRSADKQLPCGVQPSESQILLLPEKHCNNSHPALRTIFYVLIFQRLSQIQTIGNDSELTINVFRCSEF